MLTLGIVLVFVVGICAAQAVCIERLYNRVIRAEKEVAAWKLSAAHWEREAHSATEQLIA